MRRRGTAITAAAFLALGGLTVVLAGAVSAAARAPKQVTVHLVGSLTIAWQADQARGCAAAGLCGVSGSIEMLPSGAVGVSGGPPPLELVDQNAAARVVELSPSGTIETTCADLVPVDFSFSVRHVGAEGLRAVVNANYSQSLPSAGRCAGPTAGDLGALELPARKLGKSGYDLSGQTTFAAGPFTITATSTVRALFNRGEAGSGGLTTVSTSSSASAPPLNVRTRTVLREYARLEYRIAGISGALSTRFSGLPAPLCDPLGACGTSGQLDQAFTAGAGRLSFAGSRFVKRRVGSRAALADLQAGRLGLTGFAQVPFRETLTESLNRPDGSTCAERIAAAASLQELSGRRGTVPLGLEASGLFNGFVSPGRADPLRTRCPGPSGTDVLGRSSIATAPIAASALGARRLSVTFRGAGAFTASAYGGARRIPSAVARARARRRRHDPGARPHLDPGEAMTRARLLALASTIALLAPALVLTASASPRSSRGLTLSGRQVALLSIPAHFAGQLTVAFHGDPASGCASRGLCGYVGTASWRPPASGALTVIAYREHGHITYELELSPQSSNGFLSSPGGVTTAKVQLSAPLPAPSAIVSSCLDTAATGASLPLPIRRGRVSFTLRGASPALLATHCAGPVDADVTAQLPAPTLPLATVLRGRTMVALTTSRAFASHGLAGTVQSTLAIRLGRPGRTRTSQTSQTNGYHEVAVTYRATLAGSVVEHVRGATDPGACTLLGSCGLSGTLTLEPQFAKARAVIYATASARRPYRDLLTAVGVSTEGNARGILVTGSVSWGGGGLLAADLSQASTSCRDSAPLGPGGMLLLVRAGRVQASYLPGFGVAALRTRCGGPDDENGGGAFLAAGAAPVAELHRRTLKLSIDTGATSTDYGYNVRTVPKQLTLTLTRLRIREGVNASNPFGGSIILYNGTF